MEEENRRLLELNDQLAQRLHELEQQQQHAGQPQQPHNVPEQPQQQNVAPEVQAAENVNEIRNSRIPPFWQENPQLWFATVEASFALSRITSDNTRYQQVITQLDQKMLPAIADIVLNPPANGKYEAIKNRIVQSFAETSESKLRRLLRGIDPNSEKPSLLLQRIRHLAGENVGDTLLRTLFLEQLPEYARAVLSLNKNVDLSTLAVQADTIMEVTRNNNSVCAVAQKQMDVAATSRDSTMTELVAAMANLTKEVKALKHSSRSRSRDHSSFRQRSKSRSSNDSDICYFHKKFGSDARRCRSPCKMAEKSSENKDKKN